jgi:outer membrane protein insertion porin family
VVRNDVLLLTDLSADAGYAYANVAPKTEEDLENLIVNITYDIQQGRQVYFEKIIIQGNSKTRDKVIRRELQVFEQELFSGKGLKRGIRNLSRLDYFEDVKVYNYKGSADDKMILKLDVVEKPTGNFTFGGGYSTVENFFITTAISQNNLFGRGQTLKLQAEFGSRTDRYTLSFTEPWLFDIPLSGSFGLYNQEKSYDTYKNDSVGGWARVGYPIYDYTRGYLAYYYDVSDNRDIKDAAPDSVKKMAGINVESSVKATVRWDSRDKVFNPSEGSMHSTSIKYAGVGGDIGYTKYLAETGWYVPLFKSTTGFLHSEGGYVRQNPEGKLPDQERFRLGGMYSLRGFSYRAIGPEEINEAGEISKPGGDKYIQFNIEYLIPIVKKAGIVGVLFFDSGDAYAEDESIDLSNLRKSWGYGVRWYSPIGPIRIECGNIIDPQAGEDGRGRWEFAMGLVF